jgi:hypothetical protein
MRERSRSSAPLFFAEFTRRAEGKSPFAIFIRPGDDLPCLVIRSGHPQILLQAGAAHIGTDARDIRAKRRSPALIDDADRRERESA